MPGPFVAVLLGGLAIYAIADEETKKKMDEWTLKMADTLFNKPIEILTGKEQKQLLEKVEQKFS